MASSSEPPTFDPIPQELIKPSYPGNPAKEHIERIRPVRHNLRFLRDTTFNTYVPNAWGFTIYRAVFGGDSDTRFAEAVRRLEAWLRWYVRAKRYDAEDENLWLKSPDCRPLPGERDATDDMAERMWNEVIEDYPDKTLNTIEPKGEEDFSPVGRAFLLWVESLDVDTSGRIPRYDHCLIIDEVALKVLEELPAETPAVVPRDTHSPEMMELHSLLHDTWVWILDRETMEQLEEGETQEFPPWIRMRLDLIYYLWFMRPLGLIGSDWQYLAEEDGVEWDKVRWWNPHAPTFNEVRREQRARGPDAP